MHAQMGSFSHVDAANVGGAPLGWREIAAEVYTAVDSVCDQISCTSATAALAAPSATRARKEEVAI